MRANFLEDIIQTALRYSPVRNMQSLLVALHLVKKSFCTEPIDGYLIYKRPIEVTHLNCGGSHLKDEIENSLVNAFVIQIVIYVLR
jgi:hypothetical protein